MEPETEPEATKPKPEPEPIPEKYLVVADDIKSMQYGLPEYVRVDGEWIEAAVYVARCKAPIRTELKRTRQDGSPIYDVRRNAAGWDDELKKIVWPGDKVGSTAVFLGLPRFSRGLSYDKKTGQPIVDQGSLVLRFNRNTGSLVPDGEEPPEGELLKLKLIYRDIQSVRGNPATNCAVYLVQE